MSNNDALFGFTGFVGSNLRHQHEFAYQFNSSNSSVSRGKKFDQVVFSAARAEKWRANREPELDSNHVNNLLRLIDGIDAKDFTLISTVDVYDSPQKVTEDTTPVLDGLHAYGLNRLRLEEHVREKFPDALVIRLPGLFGPGLKKNIIYDLLHDNEVSQIRPDSELQYYDVTQLWKHIEYIKNCELQLVNMVSEPIKTRHLAEVVFGIELKSDDQFEVPAPMYDIWTLHSNLFQSEGKYMFSAEATISRIQSFVRNSIS